MSVDQWSGLYSAYEQAGEAEKAIQVMNTLANLPPSQGDRPMGLSSAINSRIHSTGVSRPRVRRGTHGIRPYGKRMVRSCAAILEERHGRQCLTFGTCTLPALRAEEFPLVCSKWAELVRRFFEELTRLLKRRELDTDYVQVTEIQGKRFEKWGQVAPHLHFVCQGRMSRREFWRIRPDEVRHIWERLLSNLLGRGVDGQAATRIETPRTSLAAELGKYISKGGKVIKVIQEQGKGDSLPSAWWGAAKGLKQVVKSRVREYSGEVAESLMDNLDALEAAGDVWFARIYTEFSSFTLRQGLEKLTHFKICVGAIGYFKTKAVLQMCLPLAA